MLLTYQTGSVKIGEVVRYTVTYTPSRDRILPAPELLHLRIKNTSAVALRAAFVHGPYTLSVAAYPANFRTDQKFENPRRYGVPEFEPMLKAGGSWTCQLVVPEDIRATAGMGGFLGGGEGGGAHGQGADGHHTGSVSWVVEIASQVIFSTSAAVNYDVFLARDEKSLDLNSGSPIPVMGNTAQVPQPGRVSDFQQQVLAEATAGVTIQGGAGSQHAHAHPQKGVFSRAVWLKVEDTAALWNKPQLPGWDEAGWLRAKHSGANVPVAPTVGDPRTGAPLPKRQKKVHLVVLTHGLHSNLGADMLYLKESIDAGVRQAKIDRKKRKAREKAEARGRRQDTTDTTEDEDADKPAENVASTSDAAEPLAEDEDEDSEDDEEVIVRGFSGNATKTEKGIKYLGKRLSRYILSMTYPDQPFLPTAKAASEAITHTLKASSQKLDAEGKPAHKNSTIHKRDSMEGKRLYKITKISFIAHSLGGLVQTYAIAYIQKHSPQFFDLIEPINFIAMASPFLGLNHENPLYVKFALDFGLVGRTGQDLGLTWRAPTIARSGWGAIVSNLGENAHKRMYGETQPDSKPLLRILPVGPAHTALKKFRNRTVYSNVVNDGIVPLRTSCLLFLDWQGLGRVEKARREAGLVETVVNFGWTELTGANMISPRRSPWSQNEAQGETDTGKSTPNGNASSHEVPQPPSDAVQEDDRQSIRSSHPFPQPGEHSDDLHYTASTNNSNPFTGFFNLFRSNDPPKPPSPSSPKQVKIYQRSQTIRFEASSDQTSATSSKSKVTSGHELSDDSDGLSAPPKTTFFESAGDLLNPKLPSVEYLIDPSKRPRTIFHDRIYHPEDIPPPPLKKPSTSNSLGLGARRKSFPRSITTSSNASAVNTRTPSPLASPGITPADALPSPQTKDSTATTTAATTANANKISPADSAIEVVDNSQMRVEEKIARAYHRDLSWRKVLVKVEPDAHNNMIVRRMFANAFGWPVVHHLVEAHFSDSAAARTRDDEESSRERARNPAEPPDAHGTETKADPRAGAASAKTSSHGHGQMGDAVRDDAEREIVRDLHLDTRPKGAGGRRKSEKDKLFGGSTHLSPTSPSPNGNPEERPSWDRMDSVAWTERDWMDSEEEEDDHSGAGSTTGGGTGRPSLEMRRESMMAAAGLGDRSAAAGGGSAAGSPLGSPSLSGGWNWTEKIVGKGAALRPKSPRAPRPSGGGS